MKVALITDGISPYVLGGMQKHSFYLAKYFARNKIQVDLFHFNNSSLDINTLEIFTEEEKKYIHSTVIKFPTSFRFPGHYLFNSYRYACLIFKLIKNNLSEYNFIYTKGFTGWKLISEKQKGKIKCCKIGVNFHGYEMYQIAPDLKTKIQQFILKPIVKKISKGADLVFSYGGKISEIIKHIGVNQSQIIEIPSGVESEFISKSFSTRSAKIIKFVFLGRAERRKGIQELNNAIKSLIEKKLNFKFEFIGPIPDELRIKNQNIFYHGEIREASKIRELLFNNDVLVCASWSEGFPNVILEAMSCGLAVIATDVGAVSAMVSHNNGWLIEPSAIKQLINTLIIAMNDPYLDSKKQTSLNLIKNRFNWDQISNMYIETLELK
ncbi:MAG: glycosyltransferase family 4 protein [Bacteroidota bacterium]